MPRLYHVSSCPQECYHQLLCLAYGDTNSQAVTPSLEQTSGHHSRTRIHPIRLLLCHYEALRSLYATRGMFYASELPILLRLDL